MHFVDSVSDEVYLIIIAIIITVCKLWASTTRKE